MTGGGRLVVGLDWLLDKRIVWSAKRTALDSEGMKWEGLPGIHKGTSPDLVLARDGDWREGLPREGKK